MTTTTLLVWDLDWTANPRILSTTAEGYTLRYVMTREDGLITVAIEPLDPAAKDELYRTHRRYCIRLEHFTSWDAARDFCDAFEALEGMPANAARRDLALDAGGFQGGWTLRAVRDGLGLTGAELAAMLDVAARTIRKWESGAAPIPPRVWEEVAELEAAAAEHVAAGVPEGDWSEGWRRAVYFRQRTTS